MSQHALSWTHLAIVGTGGGLGAVARFAVTRCLLSVCPGYVGLGTLVVNVVGSFAIGYLAGMGAEHRWLSPEWRMFLITGVLGGLTTFSSLSLETVLLSRQPPLMGLGLAHLGANLLFGLVAVLGGEWLARHGLAI